MQSPSTTTSIAGTPPQKFQMAKWCLYSVLSSLTQGHLTIYHRGHRRTFGDPFSDLRATIHINNDNAFRRFLFGGGVGAGESYISGDWQTDDLTAVIRIFARNQASLQRIDKRFAWLHSPVRWLLRWRRQNTHRQAKKNIAAHYDLSNALYSSFLDKRMQYSSAIYHDTQDSLEQAQENKLRAICEKLELNQNDHLLEIGTGWGGLAIYAATHYHCRVTTTTISNQQYEYAQEQIKQHGLANQITLLKQDYRTLQGSYSKLVSVEMIEAVGERFLPGYIQTCHKLLNPGGKLLLQSITIDESRFQHYRNGVDFIQKHIFPGGFLPTVSLLRQLLAHHADMKLRDIERIGDSYALTLKAWRRNFIGNFSSISKLGFDQRFYRTWLYYLQYCEGGFLERAIDTVHLLVEKSESSKS
ncbi:MAG: SAM-dependent methyltransferase [Kangiellaceae bacterium]|nr:SAM-dependent methyltransferase [Kangiellaceae bacterium]|tara:strand:+ start:3695 stop:4936 length:1242 start_codon:yes stop_codon:yes gene_type:complete